jgi:hypothetical protein
LGSLAFPRWEVGVERCSMLISTSAYFCNLVTKMHPLAILPDLDWSKADGGLFERRHDCAALKPTNIFTLEVFDTPPAIACHGDRNLGPALRLKFS